MAIAELGLPESAFQTDQPAYRNPLTIAKNKIQVFGENVQRINLKIVGAVAVASALSIGTIIAARGGGTTEEISPIPTSTPTPEASVTPTYDLQMPPKPPAGASCADVLGALTSAVGDKNYFPAGAGLIFDVKSFSSDPEHTINGTIIVDAESQTKFNSIVALEEPKLEDWYSNTQVADSLRIDWMAGKRSGQPGAYSIKDEIQSHRTGPDKGVVCLTEEGVAQ